MFITKNNQHLYLAAYQYNLARILKSIASKAKAAGATVKEGNTAIIEDRTISHRKIEAAAELEKLQALPKHQDERINQARAERVKKLTKATQEKESRHIKVNHLGSITFKLNDIYFVFSADDNPLFPVHYCKTPITDNKINKDAYFEEIKDFYFEDDIWSSHCPQKVIDNKADEIFNFMLSAKNSGIWRDTKKVRVSNHYNNGYHYETITAASRIETLNF